MSTETRLALAYRFKEFEAEKAKERMQATQFKTVDDTAYQLVGSPQVEELKTEHTTQSRGTLGEIAKRAGVSHMTAFQYDKIQIKGTEEQKANAKRLKKNKCTAYFLQKCLSSKRQKRF